MSWARGMMNGREVGYAVEAKCDWPGCDADIDRGQSFMCGPIPSDEGCKGFFCEEHRGFTLSGPATTSLCLKCLAEYEAEHPDEEDEEE